MSKALKRVVPEGHIYIRGNVLEKGNPTGVAQDRAAWAKELNLPREAEYTLFAGCGYQSMKYAEGMMGTVKGMQKVGMGMNTLIGMSKAFEKVGVDLPTIGAKVAATGKEDPYTKVLASTVSVLQKIGIDIGYMYEDEPCCGGGGMEASHPELSERLGVRRIDELLKAEAPIIATNCPACMMQLAKATKKLKANVKVMDVIEILDGAL